jgi:hypothetical protein
MNSWSHCESLDIPHDILLVWNLKFEIEIWFWNFIVYKLFWLHQIPLVFCYYAMFNDFNHFLSSLLYWWSCCESTDIPHDTLWFEIWNLKLTFEFEIQIFAASLQFERPRGEACSPLGQGISCGVSMEL